jgi:hypothetical protein
MEMLGRRHPGRLFFEEREVRAMRSGITAAIAAMQEAAESASASSDGCAHGGPCGHGGHGAAAARGGRGGARLAKKHGEAPPPPPPHTHTAEEEARGKAKDGLPLSHEHAAGVEAPHLHTGTHGPTHGDGAGAAAPPIVLSPVELAILRKRLAVLAGLSEEGSSVEGSDGDLAGSASEGGSDEEEGVHAGGGGGSTRVMPTASILAALDMDMDAIRKLMGEGADGEAAGAGAGGAPKRRRGAAGGSGSA